MLLWIVLGTPRNSELHHCDFLQISCRVRPDICRTDMAGRQLPLNDAPAATSAIGAIIMIILTDTDNYARTLQFDSAQTSITIPNLW